MISKSLQGAIPRICLECVARVGRTEATSRHRKGRRTAVTTRRQGTTSVVEEVCMVLMEFVDAPEAFQEQLETPCNTLGSTENATTAKCSEEASLPSVAKTLQDSVNTASESYDPNKSEKS